MGKNEPEEIAALIVNAHAVWRYVDKDHIPESFYEAMTKLFVATGLQEPEEEEEEDPIEVGDRVRFKLAGTWLLATVVADLGAGASGIERRVKLERDGDTLKHGTRQQGERHGMAKLTEDQVRAIRVEAATEGHRSFGRMAADYDVSAALVSRIVKRLIWKHVL